jgi:hypothetical protein
LSPPRAQFLLHRADVPDGEGNMFVPMGVDIAVGDAPIGRHGSGLRNLEELDAQIATSQHCHFGRDLRNIEDLLDLEFQHFAVPLYGFIEIGDADAAVMVFEFDRHGITWPKLWS